MANRSCSVSIFAFRTIRPAEFTSEQMSVLRQAGRARVEARLQVLLGDGKITMSVIQTQYGTLMRAIGQA